MIMADRLRGRGSHPEPVRFSDLARHRRTLC
jgi:hypothetical protein